MHCAFIDVVIVFCLWSTVTCLCVCATFCDRIDYCVYAHRRDYLRFQRWNCRNWRHCKIQTKHETHHASHIRFMCRIAICCNWKRRAARRTQTNKKIAVKNESERKMIGESIALLLMISTVPANRHSSRSSPLTLQQTWTRISEIEAKNKMNETKTEMKSKLLSSNFMAIKFKLKIASSVDLDFFIFYFSLAKKRLLNANDRNWFVLTFAHLVSVKESERLQSEGEQTCNCFMSHMKTIRVGRQWNIINKEKHVFVKKTLSSNHFTFRRSCD